MKSEESELEPCPFCSYVSSAEEVLCTTADVDEFGDKLDTVSYTAVYCAGCAASIPVRTKDPAEAIVAGPRTYEDGVRDAAEVATARAPLYDLPGKNACREVASSILALIGEAK